jgi:hypothetical protein
MKLPLLAEKEKKFLKYTKISVEEFFLKINF